MTAARPPPPISGGTLLVTRDGAFAVASDPDGDAIFVVDLAVPALVHTIALERDDEPGRLAEDGAGRVHAALRRGGALVTVVPSTGELVERRSVCGAPRGVAWEEATDHVHVACATGELVSLPASGGPAVRSLFIDSDLRDVVVAWGGLVVSRFRSAELLLLDAAGDVVRRETPPDIVDTERGRELSPTAAYRMLAHESSIYLVHQRSQSDELPIPSSGSYGARGAVVEATVTRFDPVDPPTRAPRLPLSVLVTDGAISPDGSTLSLVNSSNLGGPLGNVTLATSALDTTGPDDLPLVGTSESVTPEDARAIAVAYAPDGTPITQIRGTNGIEIHRSVPAFVPFGTSAVPDTGYLLFHLQTRSGLACASCHPEAHEDGHIWIFPGFPAPNVRRTQSLLGGFLSTAPFHWRGEIPDLASVMEDTFTERMGGMVLSAAEVDAVGRWLDALPALPGLDADPKTLARGRALFESASMGCASCHAGPSFTDSRTVDVGTGGSFQVPSLRGVAHRAPWLHAGCATTLAAAIDGSCATGDVHASAAALDADAMADLVAYVASL